MAFEDLPAGSAHYLVRCSVLGLLLLAARITSSRNRHGWKNAVIWPGLCLVFVAGLCWQAVVAIWVPEPYLDEVFHIPQAQKYCQGRWLEWDDKITTPPGLYLLSVAINRLLWLVAGDCSALTLRMTNWLAIALFPLVALQCRRLIEARLAERDSHGQRTRSAAASIYAVHTAINTALFPLLFFFSGLYYTDVFSVLIVLVAFGTHLERLGLRMEPRPWRSDALVVLLGIASLFMRQTNVFWVVVFMGGLEAVYAMRSLRPPPTSPGKFDRETMVKFYMWRYSQGEVHDPPLHKAGLDDVFFCVLSLAIAVICNPLRVLKQIWAHVVVMGMFAGFVVWNGSVVLGDKANHVATLHFAQMLYIWPLFAFFSAPLLLPAVLQPVLNFVQKPASATRPSTPRNAAGVVRLSSLLSLVGYATLVPLALVTVRYNTIVHPFTLADNRHYMFYVFRYSILRAGWVRYALAPVYVGCGLLCWKTLGGFTSSSSPATAASTSAPTKQQQVQPREKRAPAANDSGDKDDNELSDVREGRSSSSSPPPQPQPPAASISPIHDDLLSIDTPSPSPPTLSTALLWLLATTLSLVTAPLVEPRYFLLPWVFWRLLVPAWSLTPATLPAAARRYDIRLWVETAWFTLINILTMYVFVAWPFYWYAEDGSLADQGRVQRFMW